jgi:hypothetical protein
MATPLYTFLRQRGTSFYAFPSAVRDLNYDFTTSNVKFSKFVLLNIPKQEVNVISDSQEDGIMNFSKYEYGPRFYCYEPGSTTFPGNIPTNFSDQIVESLRNYVANNDEVEHISKINTKNDFYNVNEAKNPTEMIFWKWCRKLNLLNVEPAYHKIDWDKNNPDFENKNNPTSTSTDYFREYLWKEREIINYDVSDIQYIGGDDYEIEISNQSKIKNGDYFIFSGSISGNISTGVSYKVFNVSVTTSETTFSITSTGITTPTFSNVKCYLDYHKLIVYVGEIQSQSKIQTSRLNYTEVSANVYHHVGKTPTILFRINDNLNYYPNLELPVLPDQINDEIVGAENLNSPIRVNPSEYPGSFYGIYDTSDKTYKCSNGDKLRKSGDYYGVIRSNNIDLDKEEFFEELEEFNSNNIDGLSLDFDRDHYYKMNLPNVNITNFDEFNSYPFDNQPPQDFEFNAILWYYEIDNGSGEVVHNLFGIEILNNPNDDFDEYDTQNRLITTYKKLVSNGNQDGNSYIFNLNNYVSTDNSTIPLSYDPTTLSNVNSFELYQKVLNQNYLLMDNMMNIISGFTSINSKIYEMQSLLYTQTDVETLKKQMNSMTELLKLYSKMQLIDSPSNKIELDYSGIYPAVKINSVNLNYSNIETIYSNDVYIYNSINSGFTFQIPIQDSQKKMLNIKNNLNLNVSNLGITLNSDLKYGQSIDILIEPYYSSISNELDIYINFNNNGDIENKKLINIDLPTDLYVYDSVNPTGSTKSNSYYTNENNIEYSSLIDTTILNTLRIYSNKSNPLFSINDLVYLDNLYLISGTTITDFSGAYKIQTTGFSIYNYYDIVVNSEYYNKTLKNTLNLRYYKGTSINILRLDDDNTSTVENRYKITKKLI